MSVHAFFFFFTCTDCTQGYRKTNGREASLWRNCVKFLSNLTRDRARIRRWIKTRKGTRVGLEILFIFNFIRFIISETRSSLMFFPFHEFKHVFSLPFFFRSTPFDEFFFSFRFLTRRKKLERNPDWINLSPGRVYDAPHGIPGISPVDARSRRGRPYTVPCRSCADMAITWGSCTGPGISRTLAVVRTAPCLRDMKKKREKRNEFYFVIIFSLKTLCLVKSYKTSDPRYYIKKGIRFSHNFNQFPCKKRKKNPLRHSSKLQSHSSSS